MRKIKCKERILGIVALAFTLNIATIPKTAFAIEKDDGRCVAGARVQCDEADVDTLELLLDDERIAATADSGAVILEDVAESLIKLYERIDTGKAFVEYWHFVAGIATAPSEDAEETSNYEKYKKLQEAMTSLISDIQKRSGDLIWYQTNDGRWHWTMPGVVPEDPDYAPEESDRVYPNDVKFYLTKFTEAELLAHYKALAVAAVAVDPTVMAGLNSSWLSSNDDPPSGDNTPTAPGMPSVPDRPTAPDGSLVSDVPTMPNAGIRGATEEGALDLTSVVIITVGGLAMLSGIAFIAKLYLCHRI